MATKQADNRVADPHRGTRLGAALRRVGRPGDGGLDDGTGSGPGGGLAALVIGPLTIDVAGRTVTRDGVEIALTRTEFDLLLELVRHRGQVLARDTLLDRIWGYDYLGDSRLVDVAVGRLRAKVERDPAQPELVLTVRGAGYKAANPPGER